MKCNFHKLPDNPQQIPTYIGIVLRALSYSFLKSKISLGYPKKDIDI